eukprot:TRINITY_DN4428_c0_g1_i1.p1 TRINITY_DN4428_c0_g1~~TRINITY_DN4428_c0_g1_i1.p1  ORF type:complete len:650 (-),score=111.85 TRINITY_DN4428_c0_g1_i1:235-2184(-)
MGMGCNCRILLLMGFGFLMISGLLGGVSVAEKNDTDVLLRFKSLTDSYGNLGKNWSGENACKGKWMGVSCSAEGRVFFLSLPGFNLRGSISPLSALDQLRVLNLNDNRLNGSLDAITACKNLKLLYLSSNDFSGTIPANFSNLRRLLRADLSSNNLRGPIPSGFRNLSRLLTLHLQNNILSGILPDLSFLTDLNVSNNELSGEIPSKLFKKFPVSAFQGNAGLCGHSPFPACIQKPGQNPNSSPDVVVPSNPSPNPGPSAIPQKGHRAEKSKGLSTPAIVGIVVGDAAVLILLSALILAHFWRKYVREAEATSQSKTSVGIEGSGKQSPDMDRSKLVFFDRKKQFDLEDLLRASAEMLGKGTFGTAYKAVLDDGCVVAVKRLKDVGPSGKKEFEQHMDLIGKIRHAHIVRLRAYYYAKDEKLLVYDYLPNGSLFSLLHGNRGPGRTPLDWTTRVSIVLGAARGLAYIHEEYGALRIPHGNIKSSNVLLDKNGNACISDFGLALLLGPSNAARHVGYRAPEQKETKKLSQKADVYSFGVLLLEVLTGKAPAQFHSQEEEAVDLPKWVRSIVREEWTAEVFDIELLRYKNIEEEMVSMLQVALSCVSQVPDQRPKMSDVVKMIENIRVEQSPAHGEWDESPSASEDAVTSC